MSAIYGTFLTTDSLYAADDVRGLAILVEPNITKSWDLFPEDSDSSQTEIKWYDAVRYELSGEVGVAGWNSTDTAALPVTAALTSIVQIGDALRVGDEVVVVANVNRSANTIDVHERGFGSTSGASHSSGDDIYIIGSAHVESTVNQDGLVEDNVERKNYMQLIEEPVVLSVSAKNQKNQDVTSRLDEIRTKALSRALRKLNLSLLLGEAAARTATKPGSMGGLDYWLRTTSGAINDDYSGTWTEAKFKATLQRIADRGGLATHIICSTAQKAVFNALNASSVQTVRDERTAGGFITFYEADALGTLEIVADPSLPDALGVMYVVNARKISKVWMTEDSLRFEAEPANSRTIHETLQGQVTLKIKDVVTDHARIFNF
jgi:hypothetical protein